MQRDNDRDRAIEHVLRQLSAAAPADDRACIDGETLAAWTEGQLRGAEAEIIERHLSTCNRCQQLLAAFARTSPPPVVTVPLWQRWRLQWLVPIATAATVAAIWVATSPEERASYTAYRSEPSSGPSQEAPRPPESAPPAAQADSYRELKQREAEGSRANQLKEIPARKSVAPPGAAPTTPAAAEKREELERRDAQALADLQKTQAAPATAETDDAKRRDEAGQRAQPEAFRETAALGAARAPQAAPASPSQPAERSSRRDQGATLRGFTAQQISATGEIVSPNPANRWRITGGRQVERTTNSGGRWEAVALESATPLTAGMSPAPSICWIVGRGGVVYLSTDGSRFVRIAFTEPIDLISVTATDDQRATVTAADGRSFSTADRGMTWTAIRP